ncbi:MAG TPA: efflux RND transporter permease subunit [Candidatus Avidesulfovibrio excrementigallinarum]|nr:efflux RND transporter permease subunit [Candidatus Avidesulfovibrio excrementigallinarum]
MAQFFIDRPIFSWVLAILIMLAGGIAIATLPVEQFPRLAPPTITLSVTYTGASASTVQDTVTQVIEQKLNGLDGLLYMSAGSSSEGRMTMRLTFDTSVDADTAQMQVQNRLQLVLSSLPEEVKRQGITVRKVSDSFLQRYAFTSRDGSMAAVDLNDFVSSSILDPVSRINGVGDVTLYGAPYSMRIWLDPQKLNTYGLTPQDVVDAVTAQNAQLSVGQLGGAPNTPKQEINVTLLSREKLQTIDQFRDILLRVNRDGSTVYLKDVARVEMGQENYTTSARFNGNPAASIGIQLAEGANAVDTADRVAAFMERMRPLFPESVEIDIPYDTVPFVKLAIKSVVKTLFEAIALVFLIILLFLQNLRATLIPTLAVPVVLLGTFGIMSAFGFTINTLTMFGLVLAIGLLVDDAIVVVENVERLIHEEKLSPYEATCKTMKQVTSALVGVAAVLSAVFIPMAFFGGMTGAIYRQFSLTIVAAMSLSVMVAIFFTPPLCAGLLRPRETTSNSQGMCGWFNRAFDRACSGYERTVFKLVRRCGRIMVIYVLLVAGVFVLFRQMPTAFLPVEDQGVASINIFLPAGSTSRDTLKVVEEIERYFAENEPDTVNGVLMTLGIGPNGSRGQNVAQGSIRFVDWSLRTGEGQDAWSIVDRAQKHFSGMINAQVRFFLPPQVRGLGQSAGISMQLENLGGIEHARFVELREELIAKGSESPLLSNVRTSALSDIPQLRVVIDDVKAGIFGLDPEDVNDNLSTAWGGTYVNDFIDRGRVKRVYVQGDAPYRMNPQNLSLWHFRNSDGDMVPFDAFASASWTYGPAQLDRYNGVPAFLIEAATPQGVSSGTAMRELSRLVDELPAGVGYEWTGLSYQEELSGSQTTVLYALSILVVFLSLAALYESWSIPFAVVLVVPLGVLGALALSGLRGLANDIYFQVGLLAVIGLSAKNAILIVEFARELHHQGLSVLDAAVEAARLRLRPIVMTSGAFLIGVLPMALSHGAGAVSQHAIGTGVIGGTFLATSLGIFVVPVFFVVVNRLFGRDSRRNRSAYAAGGQDGAAAAQDRSAESAQSGAGQLESDSARAEDGPHPAGQ